jgi:L-ascorbate metabolism protein UlaG (beta-lactamase superfamily)
MHMLLQRLPWAGVRIAVGDLAIAIDPITRILEEFGGAREPMYPLDAFGPVDAVFVTHLHEDHFDPDAIRRAYGAGVPVHVPIETVAAARAAGLTNVRGVAVHEPIRLGGDLNVTPVPSVDGLGDVQVGWVVEGAGSRVIHCGDTLWHGYWWNLAERYGPFDAACLPVNGAVLNLPGMTPSGQPICLTPEQAVAAAVILDAKTLVPIHYGTMHHPPIYHETADIAARLEAAAANKIRVDMIGTAEILRL